MEEYTQSHYLGEIAVKAKCGDTHALDQLLRDENLKKVIYKIANQQVGPDHADAVYHEVRVRIAKFIKGWQGRSKITTWVGTITKNVCKDVLIKTEKERLTIVDVLFTDIADKDIGSTEADQIPKIAAAELLEMIRTEFLPNMGGRCQKMLELFLFEELDKHAIREQIALKRSHFNHTWKECFETLLKKIQELEKIAAEVRRQESNKKKQDCIGERYHEYYARRHNTEAVSVFGTGDWGRIGALLSCVSFGRGKTAV